MAIDARLIQKLKTRLHVQSARLYKIIEKAAVRHSVSREIAALIVAGDNGVAIHRFASAEELAAVQRIRNHQPVQAAPAVAALPAGAVARPAAKKKGAPAAKPSKKQANAVFVVHGRDLKARDNLTIFLRSLSVDVIEWEKALELTKKANPYIKEVIDVGFAHAQAIVVLLTPDDEAKLRAPFIRKGEPAHEKKLMGQPRQNVTFEAGLAFGQYEKNTILVQVGKVRPMSDVAGIHIVHLTGSPTSRRQMVGKLKVTGVKYDDSGADWLSHGKFA